MALTDKLTAVADAIRSKTGTTDPMTLDAMAAAVEGLEVGGGGSDLAKQIVERTITEFSDDTVTKIGDYALYGCGKLASIELAEVTNIGTSSFANCRTLESVNIPKLTQVAGSAFKSCTSLTNINLPSVTNVAMSGFDECTSLTSIDLPSLTTLWNSAFISCSALKSVNFPLVTTIKNQTFNGCTSLVDVKLQAATTIGQQAFSGCSLLEIIDLPSATAIDYNAFTNCYSLTTFIIRTESQMCSLANDYVFNNCYHLKGTVDAAYNPDGLKDGYIYVPDALVEDYKAASGWSTYASQIKPLSEYVEA